MTYNEYTGTRDDLIKMYIPFAYRVATNHRNLSYNNLTGLQGEALLTLCKVIDMIILTPTKWDTPIAAIIAVTIRRDLYEYGRKDRPIHQSRGAYKAGINKCPERVPIVEDIQHATISPTQTACEMNEIIDDMQLTQKQQQIVLLLLEGYNNTEIANLLNLTRSRITQIRKKIQQIVKLYLVSTR